MISAVSAILSPGVSRRIDTYEADEGGANDERSIVLGAASSDEANKHQHIPTDNEPSTAKKVRVGAANPGGPV